MMVFNEDEKRLRVLDVEGYNENVLVEAGAGAGKTSILVDRILNQIASGDLEIEDIVAITFTNKASSEMKERVQEKLLNREELEEDKIVKERYKKAIENFYRMNISTIHSFCLRVIQQRPFDEDLGLDYIVDTDNDDWEELREMISKYNNELSYKEREFLLKNGSSDIFKTMINEIRTHSEYEIISEGAEIPDHEQYKKHLTESFAKLYENLCKDETVLAGTKVAFSGKKNQGVLDYYLEGNYDSLVKDIVKFNERYKAGSDDQWFKKKSKEEAYQLLDEFNIEITELISKYKVERYNFYLSLLKGFNSFFNKKRIEDRIKLRNDDLLEYALSIIENSKEARDFFREKYKYYYIDEFQDTDSIQAKIFLYLCCDEKKLDSLIKSKSNFTLYEIPLENNKLFLVGDPKQSIYRFRGADINIYNDIRSKFESDENCELIELNRTYRFNANISQAINSRFNNNGNFYFDNNSKLISKINYGDIETVRTKREDGETIYGIYSPEIESMSNADETYEKCLLIVKDLVKNKKIHDFDDEFNDITRAIDFKDILIITYMKAESAKMGEILKKEGIPVDVTSSNSFRDSISINRIISILQLLAEGDNRYSLIKALRLCFGCGIKDLYELKKAFDKDYNEENSFMEMFSKNEEFENRFEYILENSNLIVKLKKLAELLQEQKKYTPMAFLERLLEVEDIFFSELSINSNNGRDEYQSAIQFVEELRQYDSINMKELVINAENLIASNTQNEFKLEANSNSVRVMNLHKAKGLEGDIVILFGDRKLYQDKLDSYFDYNTKIAYLAIKKSGLYKTEVISSSDNEEILEKSIQEQLEEGKRLEYVALTRAKELIIILDYKSAYEDMNDYMKPYVLEDLDGFKIVREKVEIIRSLKEIAEVDRDKTKKVKTHTITASELNKKTQKEYLGKIADNDKLRGVIVGTICHRAMEIVVNMVRNNLEIKDEWVKMALDVSMKEYLYNNNIDIVELLKSLKIYDNKKCEEEQYGKLLNRIMEEKGTKILDIFKGSKNLLDRIIESKNIYSEMGFNLYLEKDQQRCDFSDIENENLEIRGFMDLVLEHENGYDIIDFKTDQIVSEYVGRTEEYEKQLEKNYSKQLDLYKNVLRRITGLTDELIINTEIIQI